jgi:hypothetical protein
MNENAMRILIAFGISAAVVLSGCHRLGSGAEERVLPEEWDTMSSLLDPCLGTPPFQPVENSRVEFALRKPAGVLRLPTGFRETSTKRRDVREWVGVDSSRLTLTVSTAPSGGLASSGNIVLENRCALVVAGHRAFTVRLRMDDTSTATSVYAADATVVVREGVALHAWIESRSALMREMLLRALSELELSKP